MPQPLLASRSTSLVRVSLAPVAVWLVGVALMARAAGSSRYDPASREYGTNWPGDFQAVLWTSAAEIAVLWMILRPWSLRLSAGRLLRAAALFAPWLGLRLMVGMHGGPVIGAHDGWLLLLWIGMLVGTVTLDVLRRRASPDRHPRR